MPAELPLVLSAIVLAASGLVLLLPARVRARQPAGIALVALATLLPIVLDPLVDPTRSTGRALWQWSALGGPTVQASYSLDPLAATTSALTIAFTGAAFANASRVTRRHPALQGLILAVGLVTIALVVTSDLVAAIVVLSAVSALTVLTLLAFAPAAATARAAAYLALGVQAWVLSALLISRHGSAGFAMGDLRAGALTPGALLAATVGGLLFAGLYPVVAWAIESDHDSVDPGPLGSLTTMPAGVAATVMVVRVLGASGVDPSRVPLPEVAPEIRLGLIVIVLLSVALAVGLSGRVPLRPIAVGAAAIVLIAALPTLGWAHLVLLAAILTALYAGVVSLAAPEHWETVRGDLALVVIWIGIGTGSPLGIAGGLLALFARAASALISSVWLVPDLEYIALAGGSAVFATGATAALFGASRANDPVVAALGLATALVVVIVELTQLARRSPPADVPASLTASSTVTILLLTVFGATLLVPLDAAVREHMTGPRTADGAQAVLITAIAAIAVILARAGRPLLPYLERIAGRSERVMRALDPVPIGVGSFRALEAATTRASAAFGAFETRAGVWLATLLIAALLVWAVH